jgi:hypothetical protein
LPVLVVVSSAFGVRLALLNAHMRQTQLLAWHSQPLWRFAMGSLLARFALIVPQSDTVREG